MSDKALAEALMSYADDLNQGQVDRQVYLEKVSGRDEELETLLHLTEQIKRALVPVYPSPTFVKNLARQLAAVDDKNVARLGLMRGHRREVFIGAAALGSALSVLGLVAYLVRSRMQVKARVASTGQ